MNVDRPNTRQLSPVALGGVTFLLVVAFTLSASAGLREAKRHSPQRSDATPRAVVTVETMRSFRAVRAQRQVPCVAATSKARRARALAGLAAQAASAPIAGLGFAVSVLQADLPPPAIA